MNANVKSQMDVVSPTTMAMPALRVDLASAEEAPCAAAMRRAAHAAAEAQPSALEQIWEDELDTIGAAASLTELRALLERAPNPNSPTAQYLRGYCAAVTPLN